MTQGQDGDTPELSQRLHVATFKRAILPAAHGNGREDFSFDDQRHRDGVPDARQLLLKGSRKRRRIKRADHGLLLGHQPLKLRSRDPPAASRLRRWAVAIETAFDHHPLTVYPREGGSLRIDGGRHPFQQLLGELPQSRQGGHVGVRQGIGAPGHGSGVAHRVGIPLELTLVERQVCPLLWLTPRQRCQW